MRVTTWALCLGALLWACATPSNVAHSDFAPLPAYDVSAEECAASAEDGGCVALSCASGECGLYRCEDLASAPVAFRGPMPAVPVASSQQRLWGAAQPLPGRGPVLVIPWNRAEELPSQARLRKAYAEWATVPKEKHHIFPRALEEYFTERGINIHEFALAIDVRRHREIHDGKDGGPWNKDWRAFIRMKEQKGRRAMKWELMEYAGVMIQRYNLVGMPMSYWTKLDELFAVPVRGAGGK
ncbi:TIGR02269 family lipoprotein [Myxococcus sp. AM011]|uniref:SitA6 family polymorphic toxin lipoprotein n=1 Tax=Myxococcus sp. AM011 TaxID=2745200 RepID=UPI0015956093|nr:TIGR02269 family lipoprotein [Myxococcus sp. AM011]NVJ20968.1 TIGR02269 family lipoprotein [Myxococcus sp. AM011]